MVNVKGYRTGGGEHKPHRVYLYSPETGEEYSGDASDYFMAKEDHLFRDGEGNEMWLMGDYGYDPRKRQNTIKVLKKGNVTVKTLKTYK